MLTYWMESLEGKVEMLYLCGDTTLAPIELVQFLLTRDEEYDARLWVRSDGVPVWKLQRVIT